MRIYIGADHRGFELKEVVKKYLKEEEIEAQDVGNREFDPEDDYTTYALKVAEMIEGAEKSDRGILICGSGHGMEIVANRFSHVRAILAYNDEVTQQGREDEDANIMILAADWVDAEEIEERVRIFLTTEASEEARHIRRREMLSQIETRR